MFDWALKVIFQPPLCSFQLREDGCESFKHCASWHSAKQQRHPCSFFRDGANTNQNKFFANSATVLTSFQWDTPVISWRKPQAEYTKILSLGSLVQTLRMVTGYKLYLGSSFHGSPHYLNVSPPCGWQRTSKQAGLVLYPRCFSWFLQGPASCILLCFQAATDSTSLGWRGAHIWGLCTWLHDHATFKVH